MNLGLPYSVSTSTPQGPSAGSLREGWSAKWDPDVHGSGTPSWAKLQVLEPRVQLGCLPLGTDVG